MLHTNTGKFLSDDALLVNLIQKYGSALFIRINYLFYIDNLRIDSSNKINTYKVSYNIWNTMALYQMTEVKIVVPHKSLILSSKRSKIGDATEYISYEY